MNNRKNFGIFIIVIGFLLMFLTIYFIWFYEWGNEPETLVNETQTEEGADESTATLPVETEDDNETLLIVEQRERTEITKEDLQKMASSFAERFGSYSNHSNYGNIEDLKVFMTRSMQSWADNFIEENKKEYSDIYYGLTTKAVTSEIQSSTDNKVLVLVKTQRKESTGTMSNSAVYYQNIIIEFVKESGAWKVNRATWQD